MNEPPPPRRPRLAPGRVIAALLAAECLLWLSDRFACPHWHKGYAVLTGVAVVGAAFVVMLLWFVIAMVFRWRFQFSIRSLLLLTVVVALPCSWLAVQIEHAKEQRAAMKEIEAAGCAAFYIDRDSQGDREMTSFINPERLGSGLGYHFLLTTAVVSTYKRSLDGGETWIRESYSREDAEAVLLALKNLPHVNHLDLSGMPIGDSDLQVVKGLKRLQHLNISSTGISDAGLEDIRGMTNLRTLSLSSTKVTAAGVQRLRQALPDCYIDWWPPEELEE